MSVKAAAASGALLVIVGLLLLVRAGSSSASGWFGAPPPGPPQVGDSAWLAVAFMRVFGAALAALGAVVIAASRLTGKAAVSIGGAATLGLALLGCVTIAQAQALWATPAGWALAGLAVLSTISGALMTLSSMDAMKR